MESKGSWLCLQGPNISPYLEPDGSSPQLSTLFLYDPFTFLPYFSNIHFNIIFLLHIY
jgi:hypothetical protein